MKGIAEYFDERDRERRDAARERLAEQEQLRAAGAPRHPVHYWFPRGDYVTACQRDKWYSDRTSRRERTTCIRCLQAMAAGRAD